MSNPKFFSTTKEKVDYYYKIQKKAFPKLGIYISNDKILDNLDKIVSNESYIIVDYDDYGKHKPHKFNNEGNGITWRQTFNWLKETKYRPIGDHRFLENVVKQSKNKFAFFYGS